MTFNVHNSRIYEWRVHEPQLQEYKEVLGIDQSLDWTP